MTSLRQRSQVTLSYDPNIRPLLAGSRDNERERVEAQVSNSDIVKASSDDVGWLYPGTDPLTTAREWLAAGPALVVVTLGQDGAIAMANTAESYQRAVTTAVKDTVGAGDAFTAGLLDALSRAGLLGGAQRDQLATMDTAVLDDVLDFASRVASATCERPGADPPTTADLSGR